MKKIFLILVLLVFFSGFSQEKDNSKHKIYNNDLRRANNYFDHAFYAKAIPYYEKVIVETRTNEIVENLATCYYNIGDLKSSARLYGYLVNKTPDNNTYENIFKYVQALKASSNYVDANSVMREYLVEQGDTVALNTFDRDVKTQENIIAIGKRYDLENLAVNSDNSEFGMVPYNEFLVYTAAKKENHKKNVFSRYYGWNDQPYLDIYKIHKDSINKGFSASKAMSSIVNTKFHEGDVAFSKDGKTMYFTRNNYYKGKAIKDEKFITHLKLYKASLVDSVWTNIESLPFNGDNFSIEHPALSPDEKRLYFSSDMPGTLGEFDLFYVDINVDGTYGDLVNLGSEINTQHREQFPFIDDKGDLYFSSNGHFGFGGLDVFWSKLTKGGFQKPDNLGFPVNSGYDDFAFYMDSASKKGYISSNRITGKGSDDIYSFSELKPLIIEDCKQYVVGVITDKETKAPIVNSTVTITQISGNDSILIASNVTKDDGLFDGVNKCEVTVVVKAIAEGYKDAERKLIIGSERNIKNDASLALVSLASIKKKEEEEEQKKLEKEKQLELEKQKQLELEENKKVEEKLKQEEEKQRLAEEKKRLEEEKKRIAKENKRKEEEKLKAEELEKKKKEEERLIAEEENKKQQMEHIIASEPDIVKQNGKIIIKTPIINFDYKLWYVRREVKKILKPVADLMLKYPKMKIEIGSHTDIRGNEAYNRELSQKRAVSTKEFLVSKGVQGDRIATLGYGESQPIQKCQTEDACSEEEHEINRRSEFVIKEFF